MNALEIVTGLEKYQRAFDGAASDLEIERNRCERDQTARDYARLAEMVKRIGMTSVVSLLADVAEEQRDDKPGVNDWSTAMEVLAKAAEAVDLKYEESDGRPCDADMDASRAAIRAGRGTRGDYERMRRVG